MTAVLAPIVLDEQGVAWVEGTTTKVIEVALVKQTSGLPAELLQSELPHLNLTQIYAALSYYQGHRQELDAEIEEDRQFAERMREEAGESPFARRMRAEGRLR
jgi:uncharacterized protein (DUF433 family)